MNIELFITNIGFTLSTITTLGLGLFVLLKGRRQSINVTFFVFSVSVAIFELSHLIGINVRDADLSRNIFLLNANNVFIVALNTHWVLILINKVRESRKALTAIYGGAVLFVMTVALFPNSFMQASSPLLYFPNYYVHGPLYPVMTVYFFIVLGYFLYRIISTYRTSDSMMRNRIRYIIAGLIFGYTVGVVPLLPLYGFNVDPLISIFMGLYTVPFAYSIVTYELMDIRIVAKRAFLYALLVVLIGFILSALNYTSTIIIERVPSFPSWVFPFGSSFVVVMIGIFIWGKMRETDVLKYEFINVITHKFRTPLTHIKWETENLSNSALSAPDRESLERIGSSNRHMVELTDLLVSLADSDATEFQFEPEKSDLTNLVSLAADDYRKKCSARSVTFNAALPDTPLFVTIDGKRIRLALNILLDNALAYTPKNERIDLYLNVGENRVSLRVTDSGIGISKQDLPFIFSRFFRSSKAKTADTEGMGIGLYMAQSIIEKHGGSIKASSPGENKGSTFEIILPIRKGTA